MCPQTLWTTTTLAQVVLLASTFADSKLFGSWVALVTDTQCLRHTLAHGSCDTQLPQHVVHHEVQDDASCNTGLCNLATIVQSVAGRGAL